MKRIASNQAGKKTSRAVAEALEARQLFTTIDATGFSTGGNDTFLVSDRLLAGGSYEVTMTVNGTVAKQCTMLASDVLNVNFSYGTSLFDATGVHVKLKVVATYTNATIYGGLNDDLLMASSGARATVFGNEGDDEIIAVWSQGSYLEGGLGNDNLIGGLVDDTLIGGKGNDTITGGEGADLISGGEGDDAVTATADTNYYNGSKPDNISGGPGNDTLWGTIADGTIIQAGAGDDVLVSFRGKSYMYGNEGADRFYTVSNRGDYAVRGGDGDDVAYVDSTLDEAPGVIDSISQLYPSSFTGEYQRTKWGDPTPFVFV